MKVQQRTLLSCLILVIVLAVPGSARGATFPVNSTDDLDDGTCNVTHCSLREAINAANARKKR